MNLNKAFISFILISITLLLACSEIGNQPSILKNASHAPSLSKESIKNLDAMGPVIIDNGVNFAVYSENATRLELLLFDDPESARPTIQIPMTKIGNVWSVYVEGIGVGQHYGYVAWGPNWEYQKSWRPGKIDGWSTDCDEHGNRFNPNKLLTDPYALRIHRDFDWSKANPASGSHKLSSTWGASPKSVVIESKYKWSNHETTWRTARMNNSLKGHKANNLIIYEVHPKGFTKDPSSGVANPGTFRGIGQKAPYLKELGITAIELMPVMEKPDDGTYWGYNNLNYFTPEQKFAISSKEPNDVIDEFKWMVDQLHQNGIEVILDIVYNHTGEGGFWRMKSGYIKSGRYDNLILGHFDDPTAATHYSYRGLDNASYYELKKENKCEYVDDTGVGNQTRPNHTPMRRLILDSLRFWVEQMHVDGFRFDLATVLAMKDQQWWEYDPENTVVKDIINDPVLQKYNTRLISEPWHLAAYQIGNFPVATNYETSKAAWYDWNGAFRDLWRDFINHDLNVSQKQGPHAQINIPSALTGSKELFESHGRKRKPYASVNFITAHDGFTLYDLVSYDTPQNGPGPLNPVCQSNPGDPFCDLESGDQHNRSKNWNDENVKRQMIRNFFVAMLFSQGTPMILGGDEWMRTQHGNNNAYSTSSDNEYNWLRWGDYNTQSNEVGHRMFDFVKKAIQLRKTHSALLEPTEYHEVTWLAPDGSHNVDWNNGRSFTINLKNNNEPELLIFINMDPNPNNPINFKFPPGKTWGRLIDTQLYFDTDDYIKSLLSSNPKAKMQSQNITLTPTVFSEPAGYDLKSRTIVVFKEIK